MMDLRVKVRDYKLDCTFHEFGNTAGNQVGFEENRVPGMVCLIIDRDIYLSIDAAERLWHIQRDYARVPISVGAMISIQEAYRHFFNECYSSNELWFERPEDKYMKIEKDPYFDHY